MYNADYIIQAAEKLVRKYGTRDPYELCGAMHIVLYRKDLKKKLKVGAVECAVALLGNDVVLGGGSKLRNDLQTVG